MIRHFNRTFITSIKTKLSIRFHKALSCVTYVIRIRELFELWSATETGLISVAGGSSASQHWRDPQHLAGLSYR